MIDRIRRAAGSAGRDPATLSLIYNVALTLAGPGDDETIGGSPAEIADRLLSFRQLGFTGFNLIVTGTDRDWQVERIGRDVVPALREAAAAGGATN
jgi:alkanesulfonate monooxygenase SsuD/methylene tetrahydromethanopterin reductase-like flavin-dependent oxidoreductase (luciferase family)